MIGGLDAIGGVGARGAAPAQSMRLWRSLARPWVRTPPASGLDVIGERATGLAARWRLRRPELARAGRILEAAKGLNSLGEAAWRERVEEARVRACVARDDRETVDRAFSLAAAAVQRLMGFPLHFEQIAGALAMSRGCCAEMATGEGKTLTAILPAALEGWSGRGVHVLTVNDYLARRDAQITGPVYHALGLTVGVIQDTSRQRERRHEYARDVTYSADKQVVFDFLRDRLHAPLDARLVGAILEDMSGVDRWTEKLVQRGLYAAIIDEADSVLIDEAVTPAIIGSDEGAGGANATVHYRAGAAMAARLAEGRDYTVDRPLRRVRLTEAGREQVQGMAGELPPFWAGPRRREELAVLAITAKELYVNGDDYIVVDGKIVIVDRSTGRILHGRQWQLGVHQAVEAKEGLEITMDRRTTARTSYQQFFRRYARLSGMTGTASEVAHELWETYRLPVVRIPTHRPVIRRRLADRVFADQTAKFNAVADRVEELRTIGHPVLVGTRSVESSERLAAILSARGIPASVLNATREAQEAEIVAGAGTSGVVTVATNMAGRGTDIRLDEAARAAGGLAVIATERHDESRVDRQLFGRSGRQGDPGIAQAFVAFDDMLIQRYGPRPLVWLARRARGPWYSRLASVLWRLAQTISGRRAAATRREVVRAEAGLELALHHLTR